MDLMNLVPHQVSKDLRGYSVLFYGEPKSGKTTIATKFPNHLILAFEKGYAAIPGAMAMPMNSWSDFKKVLRQLKQDDVKAKFETIIIDTADIAYDYCEKHVCNVNGKEKIGDIPFGQGYTMVGKEFDECLRLIVQLNYGLVIISHAADKTFTNEQGVEYNQIVPTLGNKARLICQRMCDIIGYSRSIDTPDGLVTKLFMRGTPRYVAGSRFKYTPDSIDFNHKNLVAAISDAIDKQMEEDGAENFTSDRGNLHVITEKKLDFDVLMGAFTETTKTLMDKDPAFYGPRIVEIVERHLGKGKKISDCSRDQVEIVDLVVYDLKDFL